MLHNYTKLSGRLANDPKEFTNADGSKTVLLTLAVARGYKDKDGKNVVDMIPVEAFIPKKNVANDKRFANVCQGSPVEIEAHLAVDEYVGKDGKKVYKNKVKLDSIIFGETKAKAEERRKRLAERREELPEPEVKPTEVGAMSITDDEIDEMFAQDFEF